MLKHFDERIDRVRKADWPTLGLNAERAKVFDIAYVVLL